jgi:hypothetical protein
VEQHEPIAWAEELIEPACAVDHPRLAFLYVIASQCWMSGRIEAAVGHIEAAQTVLRSGVDELPFGAEGLLPSVYIPLGDSQRCVEWCRARLARGHDTRFITRTTLVMALTVAGSHDEGMAVAKVLTEEAEATRNPFVLSFALFTYGFAFSDTDSVRALDALRRGMVIAQDSGNRATESFLAITLARVEAEHGDPLAALEYVTVAIRNFHDSGNVAVMRSPLAILAALLDRLGRREPAATIAGYAFDPVSLAGFPEISTTIAHLRDVLGHQTYESLARKGETMTTAEMVAYAYDQIDQARAQLSAVS